MPDISIIIPTFNEARYIESTLASIRSAQSGDYDIEIILVDAGSKDETVNLAKPHCQQVIENSHYAGYKYKSLNAGAEVSSSPILMFLDADCIVPKRFDEWIIQTLRSDGVVGGAFTFAFNRRGFKYSMLRLFNHWRYCIDGLYFGDQGLFCSKEAFVSVGGFPEMRLMEAAGLVKKLNRTGRLRRIRKRLITSVRRFEEVGFYTVLWYDLIVYGLYLIGRDIDQYASNYWDKNRNNS